MVTNINEIILKMVVFITVGYLSGAVGNQPSDPCLPARMPDVSNLCVMLGLGMLNGDDVVSCLFHFQHLTCTRNAIFGSLPRFSSDRRSSVSIVRKMMKSFLAFARLFIRSQFMQRIGGTKSDVFRKWSSGSCRWQYKQSIVIFCWNSIPWFIFYREKNVKYLFIYFPSVHKRSQLQNLTIIEKQEEQSKRTDCQGL